MSKRKRYLTLEGHRKFSRELETLWNVERRRVVEEVAVAAAHGDRSENAEYIYGKKRLREIDRRVRYLQTLLDDAVVVDPAEQTALDMAYLGTWVTVEDEEGGLASWQLVGPDEFDAAARKISIESPLGRALFRRRVGESVLVRRPAGEIELTLLAIEGRPPQAKKADSH